MLLVPSDYEPLGSEHACAVCVHLNSPFCWEPQEELRDPGFCEVIKAFLATKGHYDMTHQVQDAGFCEVIEAFLATKGHYGVTHQVRVVCVHWNSEPREELRDAGYPGRHRTVLATKGHYHVLGQRRMLC
ncbi:hypothetical protein NDU88_002378 [Pleurodeles waltl]|uniref:Uncharacterized protein n=1 Tax=Pleurodeles waltl TaxID=8319 RepID=A0AAV7Q9N2_PLEWA|nr:hypothetical protein NDU88_002378 [Pleurodeles waltl]